jgi:hypothetical protein
MEYLLPNDFSSCMYSLYRIIIARRPKFGAENSRRLMNILKNVLVAVGEILGPCFLY